MTEPVEDRLRAALEALPPEVIAAYLFGSRARGDAGPQSDVDVALLLDPDPMPGFDALRLDLGGSLERAVAREIDVVVLNGAPVDLAHRVLRDSRLLLDRNRAARIRFEVRARNEYFDLLPFLRRYRRSPERAA